MVAINVVLKPFSVASSRIISDFWKSSIVLNVVFTFGKTLLFS